MASSRQTFCPLASAVLLFFMITFLSRIPVLRASNPTVIGSKRSKVCSTPGSCARVTTKRKAMSMSAETIQGSRNVLGGQLELCCNSPKTGFYRDGFCNTGPQDFGVHTVCARVTIEFLEYSKAQGNDLMTPAPEYGFPGLKDGDGWCLCASRWLEAANAGKACPIVLASTHEKTLQTVPLDLLKQYAIDA